MDGKQKKKRERWQAISKMKCLPLGECKIAACDNVTSKYTKTTRQSV
jgi:hypothetical protein